MNNKSHQAAQILHHLKRHGSIDPIEALERYKCYRLAARIFDLRGAGHVIVTQQSDDGMAKYRLMNR